MTPVVMSFPESNVDLFKLQLPKKSAWKMVKNENKLEFLKNFCNDKSGPLYLLALI